MNSPTSIQPPATVAPGSILLGPGTTVPMPFVEMRTGEEESSGNAIWSVLHAVRRRWFAIGVLGMIIGVGCSAATWSFVKSQYTAVVRFVIPARDETLLSDTQRGSGGDFELKKRSQGQIITGLEVLESTLQQIDPSKLPEFRELSVDDRLTYLKSCVSVNFPENAEIMELRVRCQDRRSAELIAKTIGEVYLKGNEVFLNLRAEVITDLETKLAGYMADFRVLQDRLARNQQLLGTDDRPEMSPAEQQYIRELTAHWEQRKDLESQIQQTKLQLAELQARQNGDGTVASIISDEELSRHTAVDAEIASQKRKVMNAEKQLKEAASETSGKGLETAIAKWNGEIERAKSKIAARTDQLRQQLELQKSLAGATVDQAALERRKQVWEAELAELKTKQPQPPATGTTGNSGIDGLASIEVDKLELDNLKELMQQARDQLNVAELARIEDISRQKEVGIRMIGDRVFVLDEADSRRKIMQSSAAGGAAFMAVAVLIVLIDLRRRRLNDPKDVNDQVQIKLLGTVPLLRGKGPKRLEQSERLTEAVDGVAATLLCRTNGDDHRVVMISSAMAGEGKTTLAANLATSLAAAGRRTLLVDFDLRRPMLHKVYQLPIGPGLAELLAHADLSNCHEYPQETTTEGLWLITAGAKRQRAIAELPEERLAELFDAFRQQFEFVIVDGPPVLPVVDTRLIARHTDGVVMSMLRDISELPKVRSACQLLQSYQVLILGGVVIGPSGDVYYGYPPERMTSSA